MMDNHPALVGIAILAAVAVLIALVACLASKNPVARRRARPIALIAVALFAGGGIAIANVNHAPFGNNTEGDKAKCQSLYSSYLTTYRGDPEKATDYPGGAQSESYYVAQCLRDAKASHGVFDNGNPAQP
jgi:hypothetical protein